LKKMNDGDKFREIMDSLDTEIERVKDMDPHGAFWLADDDIGKFGVGHKTDGVPTIDIRFTEDLTEDEFNRLLSWVKNTMYHHGYWKEK